MSTEKSDALVIRQADFSETSRVVTFFSRDFGKLAALAKGAKRLKGQFEAALDLLSTCRIVFIRKSTDSLNLLTEASLVARFRPSGRNLTALYGGTARRSDRGLRSTSPTFRRFLSNTSVTVRQTDVSTGDHPF